MERVDPEAADRFDRFLDALPGRHPEGPWGVDPGLAAAARRFHAPDPALDPDPAFVRRLEEQLMPSHAGPIGPPALVPSLPSPNGRSSRALPPPRSVAEPTRPRWPITEAAVAAVVLLALATAWAANRLAPTGTPADQRGAGIAAIASPTVGAGGAERGDAVIVDGERAESFVINVPGGWRLEQIAQEYEELGGTGGAAAFLRATEEVDRSRFAFLTDLPPGASLDGYLFPGTYTFLVDDPAANVATMLKGFDRQVAPELRQRARAMGRSLHEVVTFASIVERETELEGEFAVIADVYLSRYEAGWHLDADPTVQYAIGERGGEWWPPLSGDDFFVRDPYNTYLNGGLPPGPIANPGLAAIEAVIYPAATDYMYAVAKEDGSGEHAFASTEEEHQANIQRHLGTAAATPTAEVPPPGLMEIEPTAVPTPVNITPRSAPSTDPDAFEPTHRSTTNQSLNFRSAPSTSSEIIVALPPATPLRFLGGRAPADTPDDGPGWLEFETENGERGWLREIDVEQYERDPAAPPATPTVEAAAPAPSLDPAPRIVTLQTDLLGVVAGEEDALAAARAEVRRLAAGFGPGCRAGFVLITGNARDIADGVVLAQTVGDLLREEAPALFGDAPAESIAQPGVQPFGEVELRIFLSQGCPPAPRSTPTPTVQPSAILPSTSVDGPTATAVPTPTLTAFAPTHLVATATAVNFRAGPSFSADILRALPPQTPLQFLNERAVTEDRLRDGPLWLKFRTEDGQAGWIREIDTEQYR